MNDDQLIINSLSLYCHEIIINDAHAEFLVTRSPLLWVDIYGNIKFHSCHSVDIQYRTLAQTTVIVTLITINYR